MKINDLLIEEIMRFLNFLGTPQWKIRAETMDDYNISISNSWSVENDVRSEESISHNSRDYTPEFTTDQVSF